jgi:hypothetical protein
MAEPISGATFVSVGYTTTLTDATAGGTWSSSDTSIATVSASGIVTGVSLGSVTITYTAPDSSISTHSLEVNPVRITNGFNLDRILPAFRERIGWHQPTMANMPVLSATNRKAISGKYYDRGYHQAVSIKNLYLNQEDPDITDEQFNQWLFDEDDACATRVLTAVFNKPTLIEHKPNYTRTANLLNYNIPNQDLMVGYRINMAVGDYAGVINSISLLFSDVATFNIYLYNDLLLAPVKTQQVTTVAKSQTRVQLDWVINYIDSSNNGGNTGGNIGGVWYVCYKQSEVHASNPDCYAINEQLNLWNDTKIIGAFPFQAPTNDVYAFTRTNPSINFLSYGINIEFSSYRDYTQTIIQNPHLFDEARGLCMAINSLELIQNTTRTNETERQMTNNVARLEYDLNLSFPTKEYPFMAGIKQRLERELRSLNTKFNPPAQAMSIPIGDMTWWGDRYYQGMDIAELPPRDLPTPYNPM